MSSIHSSHLFLTVTNIVFHHLSTEHFIIGVKSARHLPNGPRPLILFSTMFQSPTLSLARNSPMPLNKNKLRNRKPNVKRMSLPRPNRKSGLLSFVLRVKPRPRSSFPRRLKSRVTASSKYAALMLRAMSPTHFRSLAHSPTSPVVTTTCCLVSIRTKRALLLCVCCPGLAGGGLRTHKTNNPALCLTS